MASGWADELTPTVELAWSPDPAIRGYFRGTVACLSSLLAAGRYEELLALIERAPYIWWLYRQYGVRALVAAEPGPEGFVRRILGRELGL